MGTGEEPVLNALEELLESDIVRPLEGSLQRFEFRHPLLWHVVRGCGCSVRGGSAAHGAE